MDFEENNTSQDNSISGQQDESIGEGDNQRDRDRRGRGARGTRFSDADASRERSRERRNCRIYVSNIPYDYRWQDLKDLFRRIVGSVEYVELFSDESGKARGCGIVEFKDPDNVEKALEKMNRYEINGREIVVKEDHGENRDQFGRIIKDVGAGGSRERDRGFARRDRDDDRMSGSRNMGNLNLSGMLSAKDFEMPYNTYGLSTSFLESLGINGPLHNKVFVANLDYKVDTKKLKQIFKLAGKVQCVDLSMDKEGNSRGFAVIEYDHPVEAVQAISMFDRQMLYERRMTVRLDRIPDKGEGIKLPEGLMGIGIGLGPNGEPLRDVARNLPNMQQPQAPHSSALSSVLGNLGMGVGNVSQSAASQPVPVAPPPNNGPSATSMLNAAANNLGLGNLTTSNLAAVVGNLKDLAGVGAALSNPLLSSSLTNLGLNLSRAAGPQKDDSAPPPPSMSNNYSTGNSYSSGYASNFNTSGGSMGRNDFESLRNSFNPNQDSGDFNSGVNNMYGSGGGGSNNGLGGGRKSDTIVIKNIPLSCTWQTLRDKFRDIGEVKFAEIRGNDVGVVRFFKEKDAEIAIKLMDGSRMEGRTVNVSFF